ncbi:hypothetical protein B0T24DRAFT_515514 [Lasiosphaeria ovina]|uniref:DUF1479 domain protein n=1 Tax=Lasiosphaeria ovina TaxID=92902 RepID=A0AAE0NK57_9PEZI|nr:hypothetical protein B0T24DRAFT_515514 [Lasiosphaeria ovina]
MGNTGVPSVDKISHGQFVDCLGRYASCIEAISASKGVKPGQKSLAELDQYRYGEALDTFALGKTESAMGLDDVKVLVEWKLRHGKFRPTLMKLVSSNEPDATKETIQKAFKHYRDKTDVAGALGILTQLRGIGPATASLLLAVHDAANVIFFADEAFYWLCCGGSKGPIKYNLKEYSSLNDKAQAVATRLGVKAVDVERVAFVLMRQQAEAASANGGGGPDWAVPASDAKKQPAKRKTPDDNSDSKTPPLARYPNHFFGLLPCLSASAKERGEMRSFSYQDPFPLHHRFSALKEGLSSTNEAALIQSWQQLLHDLSKEVGLISSKGSGIVPTIDFANIMKQEHAESFLADLKERGVAVIRKVVPQDTALRWRRDATEYIGQNSRQAQAVVPPDDPAHPQRLCELYWSAAQIEARVHPNVLAAQKFAMGGAWTPRDPGAKVTTNFPITYADRMRIQRPGSVKKGALAPTIGAHVDGGSVERWEHDGYGRAGTYREIFQGRWENYDPWESSTRISVTSDLYRGAGVCSIFRMFQGLLATGDSSASSSNSSNNTASPLPHKNASFLVCPMPRLATAYFLLRPLFSLLPSTGTWTLDRPQNSILHGAVPSCPQAINSSMHPHLQLDRSLVALPPLDPGDYVIWHPDLIHAIDGGGSDSRNNDWMSTATPTPPPCPSLYLYLYLPACPLTPINALYLSQQRRAFLRGHPGPDFGGRPAPESSSGGNGGRSPPTLLPDGPDALRAMGLLPYDEEDADTDAERAVLAVANAILFPDLYDML